MLPTRNDDAFWFGFLLGMAATVAAFAILIKQFG